MQSAILGNGLVLQNLLHMQMAQQQLLQIKDKQITNVRVCVCARVHVSDIPITKKCITTFHLPACCSTTA